MKAEASPSINPECFREQTRKVKPPIAFGRRAEQYSFLACPSLWTFVIFAIFWRLRKLEASAAQLIGSEFRNRVFHSKCGIWKQAFEWLCFSAGGSEFCSRRAV
jgi:hypothetical protein